MRRRLKIFAFAIVVAGMLLAISRSGPRASGPMPQDVYVWQRAWTPGVREAVRDRGRQFSQIVALGAQVWWSQGRPRVARVAVDWDALRTSGAPVGLAIRVNEYAGPFGPRTEAAELLCDLAAELLAEARGGSVHVAEIQIDFDAAESKLDGYRSWVEAIKTRIAPTPAVITAIPSWLDAAGFESLARAAGRYVLQVHSFERPKLSDRMTLCDPAAARRAVERAGRIGVPFRVALPTYGYVVAFDPAGQTIGLSAEGRQPSWPDRAILREVRADAEEIAELVRTWSGDRPAAMTGVIWYRLPVDSDAMNWRWPTLAAAMKGRRPRSVLRVEARRAEDGVIAIDLVNAGEAEESSAIAVIVSGDVVSADGQGGFTCATNAREARFDGRAVGGRLGAGDRRAVGWVRTRAGREVVARVEP